MSPGWHYGKSVDDAQPEAIGNFLYHIPDFEARLSEYAAGDDSGIKSKLDELVEDEVALAWQFHEQRRSA